MPELLDLQVYFSVLPVLLFSWLAFAQWARTTALTSITFFRLKSFQPIAIFLFRSSPVARILVLSGEVFRTFNVEDRLDIAPGMTGDFSESSSVSTKPITSMAVMRESAVRKLG